MVRVGTAREMKAAVDELFPSADIAVFSAAVSDFRPRTASDRKLKKGADDEALSRIEFSSRIPISLPRAVLQSARDR